VKNCLLTADFLQLYFLAQGERYADDTTGLFKPTVFELNKKLWRAVQSTIISVTASYSNSYSLNTVVSDLMALTKLMTEVANTNETESKGQKSFAIGTEEMLLERCAAMALVQMMAPIAPAFADHCWSLLNQPPAKSPKSWLWTTILGSNDSNIVSDNGIVEME
jgi:leucyl-tRNA synthetase